MASKREGPFEINEVLVPIIYRLKLPATWRIHNVSHTILLKPYQENNVHGENFTTPLPDIVDGEEVYQVEIILKHRRQGQGYQYLIKWNRYPITEASWELESAFSDDETCCHLTKNIGVIRLISDCDCGCAITE